MSYATPSNILIALIAVVTLICIIGLLALVFLWRGEDRNEDPFNHDPAARIHVSTVYDEATYEFWHRMPRRGVPPVATIRVAQTVLGEVISRVDEYRRAAASKLDPLTDPNWYRLMRPELDPVFPEWKPWALT